MKFSSVVLCSVLVQLASAAPVFVTDFVTQMVTVTVMAHQDVSTTTTTTSPASTTTSSSASTVVTTSSTVWSDATTSTSTLQDLTTSSSSYTPATSKENAATTLSTIITSPAAPATSSATTTSSTAATSSSSSSSSVSTFQQTMIDTHNAKRALHQAGDLTWDSTLESYAQDYADKYDCSGTLTHSGGPYGENLAVGYSSDGAVEAWYDEGNDYDYSSCSTYDHFTQVVWKSTTKLGCGIKHCGGSVGDYIICSYNPAGNYIGECTENVLP
ncbi:hypothetical protein HII13_005190 [Brettanomyces bruxellensis]|nr:hypothetical protein HII13_005190 [Brettanomyces bruxellensis]